MSIIGTSRLKCACQALRACHRLVPVRTKVYVSGIQPTGPPHIGNYLGFIQNWLRIQEEGTSEMKLLSIADLHSITAGFLPPGQMRRNLLESAAGLLASGVDPKKTTLFQQSHIPEHTELAWILSGLTTVNSLQGLTQFKDKASRFKSGSVPLALLSYPLLQAADVILYKGTHVLVGNDQVQHLEVMRRAVRHCNAQFGCEYFPIPEQVLSHSPRIKSLRDPTKKMSKSEPSEWSRIDVSDSKEEVRAKCLKALSDFERQISYDPVKRPAISSLINLYSSFSGKSPAEVVEQCKGLDTLGLKEQLFVIIEQTLEPVRERYFELLADPRRLRETIDEGTSRVAPLAKHNLREIRELAGFI